MIKTAIIVEDCKLTLQMTKFLLKKLGIETIFTVSNANEFKNFISKYIIPDLIITDWNIEQNLKGYDVISAMSKLGMPIAVVSSEDEKEFINNKCHWFKKPLKADQLLTWIHKIYS